MDLSLLHACPSYEAAEYASRWSRVCSASWTASSSEFALPIGYHSNVQRVAFPAFAVCLRKVQHYCQAFPSNPGVFKHKVQHLARAFPAFAVCLSKVQHLWPGFSSICGVSTQNSHIWQLYYEIPYHRKKLKGIHPRESTSPQIHHNIDPASNSHVPIHSRCSRASGVKNDKEKFKDSKICRSASHSGKYSLKY